MARMVKLLGSFVHVDEIRRADVVGNTVYVWQKNSQVPSELFGEEARRAIAVLEVNSRIEEGK